MVDPGKVLKSNLSIHGQVSKEYIFQCQAGKKYYRSYFIPVNPKSPKQQIQRSLHSLAVRNWQLLSEEEKKIWNDTYRKGKKYVRGYVAFISDFIKQGVEVALKKILQGFNNVGDGTTNITIEEVDPSRCMINFTDNEMIIDYGGSLQKWGILSAWVQSPTNLRVTASVPASFPEIAFNWQVIEFV